MDLLEIMKKEMLRRGFSHKTQAAYLYWARKFINSGFCNEDLRKLSKLNVREFLDMHIRKGSSGATVNLIHAALRFLVVEVMRKSMRLNLKYSRTPKLIPRYLSKEEVTRLLGCVRNDKHKLILQLMYGAGLRVSETLKLRKEDFDITEGYGWIRNGKGGKDRPFILPECLKEEIADQDEGYLFKGRNGLLSVRTVQEILKKASRNAGLGKKVNPHMLRHSFATHLIQDRKDAMTVQALLGHSDVRTTMLYLHSAKKKIIDVRSPLDNQNN